ncbi:hypothetical protein PVAND_002965 [Polypedilum vanderplanki]|uniref:Uncharacterized protein n=1 Tax=Polypedilum vanderplanki TaxID=319348 RepID=A0A9J6BTH4_POLVA|nr:hypothetical protein PVAND_002965 [Polypedilum vanderplanki]
MNPIPYEVASSSKQKLSLLYAFFAWNAFGFVIYSIYKGKADWAVYHGLPKDDLTPAQQYAKLLGMQKVKVIRIGKGGTEEYEIDNREQSNNEENLLEAE